VSGDHPVGILLPVAGGIEEIKSVKTLITDVMTELSTKLASYHRKPNGLFVITPKMGHSFVESLAVGKFHGVGPATAAKMHRLGIETGHDLKRSRCPSCSATSANRGHFSIGSRAASTNGQSAPIASAATRPTRIAGQTGRTISARSFTSTISAMP
jgi:IMS family protein with HHH motif